MVDFLEGVGVGVDEKSWVEDLRRASSAGSVGGEALYDACSTLLIRSISAPWLRWLAERIRR